MLIYFIGSISFSQQIKIGDWAMHLNYTNINLVINKNNTMYVGTKSGLFIYSENDNSVTTLSKLDGLSSIDITALDYNNGILLIG
jgi:ligand-binding sensor domain-containing protein